MNTAICYMTGTSNELEIRRRYDLLPKEKYNNFILKDKKCVFDSDKNIFEFDFDYFKTGTDIWTNTYFSILQFYEKYKNLDYYWLIEDDVIFNGDWSVFFDYYCGDKSDLILPSYHINCEKHINGGWYNMERNRFKGDFKPRELAGGMIVIQRFSNKLMKKMYELTLNKIHAHGEVFSVTIANDFYMKIQNIGSSFFNTDHCNTSHHFTENEISLKPINQLIHSSKIK
jgi:hypothetical protein